MTESLHDFIDSSGIFLTLNPVAKPALQMIAPGCLEGELQISLEGRSWPDLYPSYFRGPTIFWQILICSQQRMPTRPQAVFDRCRWREREREREKSLQAAVYLIGTKVVLPGFLEIMLDAVLNTQTLSGGAGRRRVVSTWFGWSEDSKESHIEKHIFPKAKAFLREITEITTYNR